MLTKFLINSLIFFIPFSIFAQNNLKPYVEFPHVIINHAGNTEKPIK